MMAAVAQEKAAVVLLVAAAALLLLLLLPSPEVQAVAATPVTPTVAEGGVLEMAAALPSAARLAIPLS